MMETEKILLRIVELIQDDPELHRAVVSLIEALAADRLMSSYLKQHKLEVMWAAEKEAKRP